MDVTELTIQQRYEFLQKQSEVIAAITERIKTVESKLTLTSDTINSYTTLWGESIKNYEDLRHNINESVGALKEQIAEYKEETDRFKQYAKGIDENLEARLTNFKERFENLNRTLEILEKGVKAIRETDLDRINERIKELPKLEAIRNELSNSTSPLVTKNDFNSLGQKVANIEGAVNSHFRNNIIGLVLALATIIGTNVIAYYTFVSKIDSLKPPVTSQGSPSPASTTNPLSKPTP
jgi:tetrahydromethanopterin S-methyltransferase subunit B